MKSLFFLPGLLEDAEAFAAVIGGLRESAACSVADLTRDDSVAALARSALEQAPAGRFLMAGHSMGGYVALEVMRQAPERVAGLALLNTHARPDSEEATANRRRAMELALRDFEAVIAALVPKLMTPAHLADPVLAGIVSGMARAVGQEGFRRQQEAIIARVDSRPSLAAIRCPTVVVAGHDDALMPVELLKELSDGISGASLTVIEDCGHMASIEQPDKVLQALKPWVERTTP